VDENDNVFFFKGKSYSPQCNTNRMIVERNLAQGLETHAVLVPWAWVKFNIRDYA
jgi:glutaredoxin-related protein